MNKACAAAVLAGLLAGGAGAEEPDGGENPERIYPNKDVWTVEARPATILKECPDLRLQTSLFNGHVHAAVYEDSKRPRILFCLSPDAVELFSVKRNGQLVEPEGELSVKVAGYLATPDGPVDDFDNPIDFRLGWWLELKRTDTLEVIGRVVTGDSKTDLVIHYDPDRLWRGRMDLPEFTRETEGPFDAYEISLESLVQRVLEVLEERNDCRVKLAAGRFPVTLRRWDEKLLQGDFLSMSVTVDRRVSVNDGPAREEVTLPEFEQRLELYTAGARAAEGTAKIRLRIHERCSDKVFREVLGALSDARIETVHLEAMDRNRGDEPVRPE